MSDEISKVKTRLEKKQSGDLMLNNQATAFILDLSASMDSRFGKSIRSRLSVEKEAFKEIIKARMSAQDATGDRMGLIGMGCAGSRSVKIMADIGYVSEQTIQSVIPARVGSCTPMGESIIQAQEMLDRTDSDFVKVVIMTDGTPNGRYDKEWIIERVSYLFREEGIVFDTIGIGSSLTEGSSSYSGYDSAFLRRLAEVGGGTFTEANEPEDLIRLLKNEESERRALIGEGVRLLPAPQTKSC